MGIEFKPKEKNVVVSVAKGIAGYKIPASVYDVEDNSSLKNRAAWYRKLLGIDNALFFSEDAGPNGNVPSETLIILDCLPTQVSPSTLYEFASEGKSGQYTVPLFPLFTKDVFMFIPKSNTGDDDIVKS